MASIPITTTTFAMFFAATLLGERWLATRRPDLSRSARQSLVLFCLVVMAATTCVVDWVAFGAA